MKLIVGLGNPGKDYDHTRHNTGYMTLDYFSEKYNATFKLDTKLEGFISTINIDGKKVILLKPTTYMNLSGNSISKVLNYYKIDVKDMLVIHDDLDLPVGAIRFRNHGSAGGHNGLKSIIAHVGERFNRCKVGIGKSNDTISHVLGKFDKEDQIMIFAEAVTIANAVLDFIKGSTFEDIMNKYNSKAVAEKQMATV